MLRLVVLGVRHGSLDVARVEAREESRPARLGDARGTRDRDVERGAAIRRGLFELGEPAIRERRERRERLVPHGFADRFPGAAEIADAREELGSHEPGAVSR